MLASYFLAKLRGVLRYFATIGRILFQSGTVGRSLRVLTPLVMHRGLDFFFTCLAAAVAISALMTRIFVPEVNFDEYAEQFYRVVILLLTSLLGGLALKLVKPGTKWTHYLVCLAYIHGVTLIILAVFQTGLSFIFLWNGPDLAAFAERFNAALQAGQNAFSQNSHPCWLATAERVHLPCRLFLSGGELWGRSGEWVVLIWTLLGGLQITKHALGIKRRYIVLAPFIAATVIGIPIALLYHWYRRRKQQTGVVNPMAEVARAAR